MNISLTSVFRARHPPLIISCLATYRNRSVMFILMVTPGVGGSWLLGTPSCYHHLTLSRSMSGVTALAGSTLTHVLTSLAPHRDWVSDVGAALRAVREEGVRYALEIICRDALHNKELTLWRKLLLPNSLVIQKLQGCQIQWKRMKRKLSSLSLVISKARLWFCAVGRWYGRGEN